MTEKSALEVSEMYVKIIQLSSKFWYLHLFPEQLLRSGLDKFITCVAASQEFSHQNIPSKVQELALLE